MIMSAREQVTLLSPDATERIARRNARLFPAISGGIAGALGAGTGVAAVQTMRTAGMSVPKHLRIGLPIFGGLSAAGGVAAPQLRRLKKSHKYERAQANRIIRLAKQQGYEPVLQDKWSKIDRKKVRNILRQAGGRHAEEAGVKRPPLKRMFRNPFRKEKKAMSGFGEELYDIIKEAGGPPTRSVVESVRKLRLQRMAKQLRGELTRPGGSMWQAAREAREAVSQHLRPQLGAGYGAAAIAGRRWKRS